MTQAREGYAARVRDVTATATKSDTYIVGIDEGRLTPLDAYDERLRAGTHWIESTTVWENVR